MPAEEVTDSWDPYHYPWSGVVAKVVPESTGLNPGACSFRSTFPPRCDRGLPAHVSPWKQGRQLSYVA